MAKSEYEIQADKFMQDTGSKMIVGSPDYGKMPWDDKDDRYIFPITFVRKVDGKTRQFSLKFGQIIADGDKKPLRCAGLLAEEQPRLVRGLLRRLRI